MVNNNFVYISIKILIAAINLIGHHHSEVHHENGSFIPISYFVNGPIEGTEIYQIWMAIATPAVGNKSIYESTKDSEVSTVSNSENEESNLIESDMCSGDYLLNYQVNSFHLNSVLFSTNHLFCLSVCQTDWKWRVRLCSSSCSTDGQQTGCSQIHQKIKSLP